MDILNIDTVVGPLDKIYKDGQKGSFIIKYNSKGQKIYFSQYSNGKLNDRIEIFNPEGRLIAAGHMKDNKPKGLWLFVDKDLNVDSSNVVIEGKNFPVDKMNFIYDTVKLTTDYDTFFLKKPRKWGVITVNDKYNIGVVEDTMGINSHHAKSIMTINRFKNKIDFQFAVDYIMKYIKENTESFKIIKEEYNQNSFARFYLMEFEEIIESQKKLLVAALFIRDENLYTIWGSANSMNEVDYSVYSWLLRDIANSLVRK